VKLNKKSISIVIVGLMLSSSMSLASSFGISNSASSNDAVQQPAQVKSTSTVAQQPVSTNQTSGNSQSSSNADDILGDTSIGQEAFMKMQSNLMPLSTDEIKTLKKKYYDTQKAVSAEPGVAPKPTSSSVIVNLSPGATPPVIRLKAGYISSLVFLDSTGQPWPITAYDLGNPGSFNIQPTTPDGKTNTMLVQASSTYQPGNLAVMLKGQNTPIMLTLMPGQQAVDYRVDLRVPGMGPNANPTSDGMPQSSDPMLLSFLDGVAPRGAKALEIEGGGESQAWTYAHHMYIRTRMTLLSPSWMSTMSSPDGTHVYELVSAPVILVSDHGKLMQLKVKG